MDIRRTYELQGKKTDILFSSGRRDLVKYISSYRERLFFVIDSHVAEFWRDGSFPELSAVVTGGDGNKTAEQMVKIRDRALECGITTASRFVVIGGGVSIDLTATCCCAYFPGAKLTVVPTTVMAMTDGSIGGKCGLNRGKERYVCRDLYPADEIIIEVGFLSKTSLANFRNGFGEVIKHSVISPTSGLMDLLMEKREEMRMLDREVLEDVLMKSMDTKITYLTVAEKKPVAEKILDLGHHFGFAFMVEEEGGIKHGEAVVWGIAKALELGLEKEVTDRSFADKVRKLMALYEYDTDYRFPRNVLERLLTSYSSAYGVDEHEFIIMKDQGKPQFMKVDTGSIPWLLS